VVHKTVVTRALQPGVKLSEHDKRTRLARELSKIDPQEERRMAEESMSDRPWAEY
jgi:hypothetical protein